MALLQPNTEIEYPESDGKPMGETDLHRRWMMCIYNLLDQRYRGQQVYVSSDLLLYYEQGNPKKFVVPDVFVVKESSPEMRRTYRLWDEGRAPDVVFEVTSRATRRVDEGRKPEIYAKIGVKELFLYDPNCDYLDPSLQGYVLQPDGPMRIEPDASGVIASQELGIHLRLDGLKLVMTDAATGDVLLTEAEAERAVREAAEAQSAALAEELQQLRKQIDQRKSNGE